MYRICLVTFIALSLAGCGGDWTPEMQTAKNFEMELRELHAEMTTTYAIYDMEFFDAVSTGHFQRIADMEEDLRRCRELEAQLSALKTDADLDRMADRTSGLELILKLRLAPSEEARESIRQEHMDLLKRLGADRR